MEQDAWLEDERERYQYFMRPEPKEGMGPIETAYDPIFGREVRSREMDVGMTRNAKPEDKRRLRVFLEPLPHIRIEKAKDLQGWYQNKSNPGHRPRPCFSDAILTEPYGGYCTVGCAFCYVNSGFRGYRGSGLVSVPLNYGRQIASQLKGMRTAFAGYFSSFTDPFLPLEEVYHNSQEGSGAFVNEGLPIFFLSRLAYPGWAIDLLKRNKYSYAQKSINTPDPEDWKKLSPAALPLQDHLDEIRELHNRGVYVSIQVNPVIPGIVNHDDVEQLFGLLAEAGADHVIVKFVEAGYSWAPAMVERITKRFGDNRAAAFRDLFIQNIGGQKTVAEEYRLEGHRRYSKAAKACGLTYATCYEFAYVRDGAGNVVDKIGRSIGREFITSAQCHGQRVPAYTRLFPGASFAEVGECPPTGCLHCADDNAGKPRCGSEIFGQAKANRMAEFKTPIYGDV